ncbi:hypothetical protein L7F22_032076 [Adiantum nelumboides]|nr:hypothetical protein [Adiantum nelumboides]
MLRQVFCGVSPFLRYRSFLSTKPKAADWRTWHRSLAPTPTSPVASPRHALMAAHLTCTTSIATLCLRHSEPHDDDAAIPTSRADEEPVITDDNSPAILAAVRDRAVAENNPLETSFADDDGAVATQPAALDANAVANEAALKATDNADTQPVHPGGTLKEHPLGVSCLLLARHGEFFKLVHPHGADCDGHDTIINASLGSLEAEYPAAILAAEEVAGAPPSVEPAMATISCIPEDEDVAVQGCLAAAGPAHPADTNFVEIIEYNPSAAKLTVVPHATQAATNPNDVIATLVLADAFANPVAKAPAPTSQALAVDNNVPSVDTLDAAVHASLVLANGHSVMHPADAPHQENQALEAPYPLALRAAKAATFVASSGPRPRSQFEAPAALLPTQRAGPTESISEAYPNTPSASHPMSSLAGLPTLHQGGKPFPWGTFACSKRAPRRSHNPGSSQQSQTPSYR